MADRVLRADGAFLDQRLDRVKRVEQKMGIHLPAQRHPSRFVSGGLSSESVFFFALHIPVILESDVRGAPAQVHSEGADRASQQRFPSPDRLPTRGLAGDACPYSTEQS